MAEKVTKMWIKVDLQCSRCYKKIKKILCKYPQIRDQIYDEKKNEVEITVVCCSPEKIQQKIIRKGGETVQSIKTKKVRFDLPTKEAAKLPAPVLVPAPPLKAPKPSPPKPPQQVPAPPPLKVPTLVAGFPPMPAYPMVPVYPMVGERCRPPCYGGYGSGPCYCGRRRPVMCYDGCGRPAGQGWPVMCDAGCGRPACECLGGNRGYYVSPCDYFSEENATACTVM